MSPAWCSSTPTQLAWNEGGGRWEEETWHKSIYYSGEKTNTEHEDTSRAEYAVSKDGLCEQAYSYHKCAVYTVTVTD